MTVVGRIGVGVLTAMGVAAVLTLCGMSNGKPAAIGAVVGVIVQMSLRAFARNAKTN
jgi:hypothetical protein